MSILSYGWPTTWHYPPELDTLEMQTPNIITTRITHATQEQKQMWRDRGKIVLHQMVSLPVLLTTDGALLAAMVENTEGYPIDGLSLDEFCLGAYDAVKLERIKLALIACREKYSHMLLHGWLGYSLSRIDSKLVRMIYNLCDWVSPEVYLREGEVLTFQTFLSRYRHQIDMSRTLMGIVTHKEYRTTTDGWLSHIEKQIHRIKALGCSGIAMWAPMHLKSSDERKRLDELLK